MFFTIKRTSLFLGSFRNATIKQGASLYAQLYTYSGAPLGWVSALHSNIRLTLK